MKQILTICLLLATLSGIAQNKTGITIEKFEDALNHWYMDHRKASYERYGVEEYQAIADNIVAYQNEDGGWPKNLDWLAKLSPDSVKQALKPRHRLSTLDNRNIYTQIEYLSGVYTLTGEKRYRESASRGIDYLLTSQYPNGGWRGWDADAITYNDGCIAGVLFLWYDVLHNEPIYGWIKSATRRKIKDSMERGIELILKTQYLQNGVKTIWGQQHDHATLLPCKARAYEHPSLAASESSELLMLLMQLEEPTPEIIEAVKAGCAWLEANKIEGKRVETIEMPEGNPEDPNIKRDRRLVDDPEAKPLWARFYELSDNTPFLCNRDGVKVYRLEDVAPERRVGYAWYGTWGGKVLKEYRKWLKRIEAE